MINQVVRYVAKKTGKELSLTMFAQFCAEFSIAGLSLLTSYSVAMAQVDVDDVLSRASNKSVVRDSRVDTSTLDVMQQATGDAISKANSIDEAHERYRKDIEATKDSGTGSGRQDSAKVSEREKNPSQHSNPRESNRRGDTVQILRESWTLKDELKAITILCPSGMEKAYEYFPKTGKYCTPSFSCNSDQNWIHRALCN